jgi:hypothetical protein
MSGFTNISMAIGASRVPESVLIILAQSVLGGTTDQAIRTSFDGGSSWSSPNTPAAGQAFVAGAYSVSRQESLLLSSSGIILRSTDMVSFIDLVNDIGPGLWTDMIRVEPLGLYIACGQDAGDPTHRISTSPTGVTWTRRDSVTERLWVKLGFNSVTGQILCGGSNSNVRPFIQSANGVSWVLPVGAYAGARGCWEMAFSTAGRYLFGDRGSTDPSHSDDLVTFTVDTNLVSGQTMAAYDPLHDLSIMGTAGSGINTSPATGAMNYSQRTATTPFDSVEDMLWQDQFSQLIGIRPVVGAESDTRIIKSVNGILYTQTIPGFPEVLYGKIFEAFR